MKKRFRRITSALLSAALMFGCVGFSASAEQSNLSPDEQYIALMEVIDWGEFDNHVDKVNASQIPDYLLNQMTTEQLVNAVLHYPYLIDMLAYNTYEGGFQAVLEDFNGLQELVKREGAAKLLSKHMETAPVILNTRSVNNDVLYDSIMQSMFLDVMLAQPEFVNQLSEQEFEEILAAVDEKIELQVTLPETYSGSTGLFYKAMGEQIDTYTVNKIIKTPGGKDVTVREWTSSDKDWSAQEIAANGSYYHSRYPNAVFLQNSTKRYNCHSYAWYSQTHNNNNYWIPNAVPYMTDGACRQIVSPSTGVRVYYDDGSYDKLEDHSAYVVRVSSGVVTVVSKWGNMVLAEHTMADCPYYNGRTLRYYKY